MKRGSPTRPEMHDSKGDVRIGQTVAGPLQPPLEGGRVEQCRLDDAFSLMLDTSTGRRGAETRR